MVNQRLCGLVLVRYGAAVQSFNYKNFLPIGRPEFAVRYLGQWGVDEIIVVDMTSRAERAGPNLDLLKNLARHNLTPLTFGGGISSVEQAIQAIQNGADKVSINSQTLSNPKLVGEISREIGAQSCVVSVDVLRRGRSYKVWASDLRQPTATELVEHLQKCEDLGAGEFLVTAIDQDGRGEGCDLDLAELAAGATSVPTVIAGGVGTPRHIEELLHIHKVRGVVVGNRWMHTEHSVAVFKAALSASIPQRQDYSFKYLPNGIDSQGRPKKIDEDALAEMLFLKIHEEEV